MELRQVSLVVERHTDLEHAVARFEHWHRNHLFLQGQHVLDLDPFVDVGLEVAQIEKLVVKPGYYADFLVGLPLLQDSKLLMYVIQMSSSYC